MATQSPFSLLGNLAERVAQAVQPPAWFVSETQQRVVLFLNHIVMQEPQAMERLVRQTGRIALVQWRRFSMALVVTPAGLFNLAAEGAQPDLRLQVTDTNPLAMAQAALRGDKPAIRIEGDVQLAADINWLVENLSWDVEEDLARVIGDVPAHALANLALAAANAIRQFVGKAAGQSRPSGWQRPAFSVKQSPSSDAFFVRGPLSGWYCAMVWMSWCSPAFDARGSVGCGALSLLGANSMRRAASGCARHWRSWGPFLSNLARCSRRAGICCRRMWPKSWPSCRPGAAV